MKETLVLRRYIESLGKVHFVIPANTGGDGKAESFADCDKREEILPAVSSELKQLSQRHLFED